MRILLTFLGIAIACTTISEAKSLLSQPIIKNINQRNVQSGTFLTNLHHFTPQDREPVRFTYFFNDEFHTPNGPIFIYLNDIGEFTTEWLEQGLMHDIAESMNGILLTSEIRYFGSNVPTESASFENLAFLTIEQVLRDIADFVTFIKQRHNAQTSKVVLWGLGYGGTLAALARQKFPHLINGAWSSSGIFLATLHTTHTFDHLTHILQTPEEPGCADNVRTIFTEMANLIDANDGVQLQETLSMCDPLNTGSEADVAAFFYQQIEFISEALNRFHHEGLHHFCGDISEGVSLSAYGDWLRHVYNDVPCFTFSYDFLREMGTMEEWGQPGLTLGFRQAFYIRCTQLGQFQITSNNSIFGDRITPEFYEQICEDLFGEEYNADLLERTVDGLTHAYGGLHPDPTNTIYVNGQLDSWFTHGILEVPEENLHTIVWILPDHGKGGVDLASVSEEDSELLVEVKNSIKEMIALF